MGIRWLWHAFTFARQRAGRNNKLDIPVILWRGGPTERRKLQQADSANPTAWLFLCLFADVKILFGMALCYNSIDAGCGEMSRAKA